MASPVAPPAAVRGMTIWQPQLFSLTANMPCLQIKEEERPFATVPISYLRAYRCLFRNEWFLPISRIRIRFIRIRIQPKISVRIQIQGDMWIRIPDPGLPMYNKVLDINYKYNDIFFFFYSTGGDHMCLSSKNA